MTRIVLHMSPRPPFRLDLTAWALRRQPHNRIDQWDGRTYRRVVVMEGTPLLVEATQEGGKEKPRLQVSVSGRKIVSAERTRRAVASLLRKLLGTSDDLSGFYGLARKDPRLDALAQVFLGVKPPRFPSLFEALINAFACQQLSLAVGITLLNRLSETYGASIRAGGELLHAFPGPEDLAGARNSDLRTLGFSRQKAFAITALARSLRDNEAGLKGAARMDDQDAINELRKITGVGRWSAEYVLLRGLGRLAVFPGDDVGAQNNLQRFLHLADKPDYQSIQRIMLRWQPWGGLVYFHFLLQKLSSKGFIQPREPDRDLLWIHRH